MKSIPASRLLDNADLRRFTENELAKFAEEAHATGKSLAYVIKAKSFDMLAPNHPFFFVAVAWECSLQLAIPERALQIMGLCKVYTAEEAKEKIAQWEPTTGTSSMDWAFRNRPLPMLADVIGDRVPWTRPTDRGQRLREWGFSPVADVSPGDLIFYHSDIMGTVKSWDGEYVWSGRSQYAGVGLGPGRVQTKLGETAGVYEHPVDKVPWDFGTHYTIWHCSGLETWPSRVPQAQR